MSENRQEIESEGCAVFVGLMAFAFGIGIAVGFVLFGGAS